MPPKNPIAYQKILASEEQELQKCLSITQGKTLSPAEYEAATREFKELIDTPWKKNEPIYIAPEDHLQLQELVVAIQQNKLPYHAFIRDTYGIIWPLVLRLYYGLSNGFKISIEQMNSILQISYCLSANIATENIPFFERKNLCITQEAMPFLHHTFLSQNANDLEVFNTTGVIPQKINQQITQFREALSNDTIPKAEKYLQKILLNIENVEYKKPENSPLKIHIRFKPEFHSILKKNGLELFYMTAFTQKGYYHFIIENDQLFLLIPSDTMLKLYFNITNPERNVRYVNRLGIITPQMTEAYTNRNEHVGNLFAPGITNPRTAHSTDALPISIKIHDDYHYFLNASLDKKMHSQLLRINSILRLALNDQKIITHETHRCADREIKNKPVFFMETIEKIFRDSSSVMLVLIDIILNPSQWPYVSNENCEHLINKLLPWKETSFAQLEAAVKYYEKAIARRNIPRLAVLVLSHFGLNDRNFCQALVKMLQNEPTYTQIKWQKSDTKNVAPVFIQQDQIYTFEEIRALSPIERIQKFAPTISLYTLPAYDNTKHEELLATITAQGGQPVLDENTQKISHFKMASHLLTRDIRNVLQLDRCKLKNLTSEQQNYLESIPDIVCESENSNATLCTFPKNRRPLVEKTCSQWKKLDSDITKIQACYRGHAQRQTLFKNQLDHETSTLSVTQNESMPVVQINKK